MEVKTGTRIRYDGQKKRPGVVFEGVTQKNVGE